MSAPLIEFPADGTERARPFPHSVLSTEPAPRPADAGCGWERAGLGLGVDERGPGPGDTGPLPDFDTLIVAAVQGLTPQLLERRQAPELERAIADFKGWPAAVARPPAA